MQLFLVRNVLKAYQRGSLTRNIELVHIYFEQNFLILVTITTSGRISQRSFNFDVILVVEEGICVWLEILRDIIEKF